MTKSDNGSKLVSIVIPKARGVQKSLFRVGTPKEMEDMSISLPCIGQVIHCRFCTFLSSPWL